MLFRSTENDIAAARVTVNRAVVSAIEDGVTRARYATVTAANALKVDNSGVTQTVSGTVAVSGTVTVDSELPGALTLANATATPTAPGWGWRSSKCRRPGRHPDQPDFAIPTTIGSGPKPIVFDLD